MEILTLLFKLNVWPFLAAQKAVDPMAKKREIEERLAVLNGSQPTAKSMRALRHHPLLPLTFN